MQKQTITLNQNFKYAIKENTYNTKYIFILFI